MNAGALNHLELLRRTLLGQLQTADVNLRAGLHQHGMNAIVRAIWKGRSPTSAKPPSRSTSKPKSAPFRNWPTSLRALNKCRPTCAPNKRPLTNPQPQSMSDLCLNALPTVFLSAI